MNFYGCGSNRATNFLGRCVGVFGTVRNTHAAQKSSDMRQPLSLEYHNDSAAAQNKMQQGLPTEIACATIKDK
jgi:hypothetical protein